MRVERDSCEITEIHGPNNDKAEPVDVLWLLCRKLGVHGDREELFPGNGVLSMFLNGPADPETPSVVVGGYGNWWRTGEIVLHDSRNDRWSRLLWHAGAWCAVGLSHLDSNAFEAMRRLERRIASLAWAAGPAGRRSPGGRRGRHRRSAHARRATGGRRASHR